MSNTERIELFTVRIDEQASIGDISRFKQCLSNDGYHVEINLGDLEAYVMRDKIDD
jgi:hypothetical protein